MESRWPQSRNGSILFILVLVIPIVLFLAYDKHLQDKIPGLTWEVSASEGRSARSVATPTPLAQNNNGVETGADLANPIDDEIREVFGKDADKAFLLLSCENSTHNPDAVNTAGNYPEGSRDIGVFQINEYWQGVNGRFLFNPSINIRIAHDIFKANGDFHLWTCGRKLGI